MIWMLQGYTHYHRSFDGRQCNCIISQRPFNRQSSDLSTPPDTHPHPPTERAASAIPRSHRVLAVR